MSHIAAAAVAQRPAFSPVAEAYARVRTLNAARAAAGLPLDLGRAVSVAYRLTMIEAAEAETRLCAGRARRTARVLDRWMDVPLAALPRVIRGDLDAAGLT